MTVVEQNSPATGAAAGLDVVQDMLPTSQESASETPYSWAAARIIPGSGLRHEHSTAYRAMLPSG